MKSISLLILFCLFNLSILSNLFFNWRITDLEKEQLKEEVFSLFSSNTELYKNIIKKLNQKKNIITKPQNSKNLEKKEEDPTLHLSRYTHCQKCMTFLQSLKRIKEKYGFQNIYENFKVALCYIVEGFNILGKDGCESVVDKYGPIVVENIFTRYVNSYYLCEKLDLCPAENPKKFINTEEYAARVVKGKPNKKKEAIKENGKKIKFLQMTDIHLDLNYKEGSPATCIYPLCCRNYENTKGKTDQLCGKYGYEGKADLSLELFNSFIKDISTKDFDFIIWTGDNGSHDVWLINQDEVYKASEIIRDGLNNQFNFKKPIFYCLGNHEKFPNDSFKDDEKELLEHYAQIFKGYITDEKAYEDFKKYGYYSMKYDKNLRIISLNCLNCDSFNFNLLNSTKKHVKDSFDWLENELQKAEKNNEFVYILNHFPLNGEFTWPECAKRFQALFDRYEYNIRGIFSGHTHRDDIEGITEYFNKNKIIHLNFVAPQLTTFDNKLPSYRIYTVDDETKQILDYEQFRFNLTRSNQEGKPYWYSAYNASQFYGVKNMLEYNKIINFEKMDEYVFNQLSGGRNAINKRKNLDRQKSAKCVMTTNNFYEYFECYAPEYSFRYEFLYIFINFLIDPLEE